MASVVVPLIVSPILGLVFENLSFLIRREFGPLWGVEKDLMKLSNTLSSIRLVLEDAEERQIKDKVTRDWLRKLKDAAYDADDILDDCAQLEALSKESDAGDSISCIHQVSHIFACLYVKQILFRHKMKKKIKDIRITFEEIADERSKFHLSPGVAQDGVNADLHGINRESGSNLETPIYGRDGEKENIIETLLENSIHRNNLSISPIVGIGGVGKTTLVQWIFNDERVQEHFGTKIWVCVSEDFGLKKISKKIIGNITGEECDLNDLSTLQNRLRRLLTGTRFLLVLDDVWDADLDKWNSVKYLLICGAIGSSVLVTTRLQKVVDSIFRIQTVADSATCVVNATVNLKTLSKRDSWSLFKAHAFNKKNEGNEELTSVGQEIISKCGGVPLALKALGGMLHDKGEESWKAAKNSDLWNIPELEEKTVLPALKLSYTHLPPHLRQCFAYCSIYPKDYEVEKEMLIHQWMANGFLQPSTRMEAEDIGHEILNKLVRLSFLEETHEYISQNGRFCKMHDLMHDLACSVMVNECSRMKISEIQDVPQRVRIRHASVACETPDSVSTLNTGSRPELFFRTLLFLQRDTDVTLDHLLSNFSRLKCLRVLDLAGIWNIHSLPEWIESLRLLRYLNLSNTNIASLPEAVCSLRNLETLVLSRNERFTTLPSSIANLKRLRYIDLSYTIIKVLPESICSLTNLQTLRLNTCIKLQILPRGIKNLRSLRHLDYFRHAGLVNHIPIGIGQLTRLETLTYFVVSAPDENSSECGADIQELERLNLIKGELNIKGLRHVGDPCDAIKADIRSKSKLSDLTLWWSGGADEANSSSSQENNDHSKEVLEGLQPHPNLLLLGIEGYPGATFPRWIENSATTLPKLHTLALFDMPNVEINQLPHIPSCLKLLIIRGCPKLRLPTASTLPLSVEELGLEECNDPTLSSVGKLCHLTFLSLGGFQQPLPEAPLQRLACLKTLSIVRSLKLQSFPTKLKNLSTLKTLRIRDCPDLDSLKEEELRNLTSLQELKIVNCESITSLSISSSSTTASSSSVNHLPALKVLEIDGCPKLELPIVDLELLISLQELKLFNLPHLTYLPDRIQHVTTLQSLVIQDCVDLKELPESLLQNLPPSLHTLYMAECHPELHTRCEKDKGEYWPKISHIHVRSIHSLS